MPGTPVYFVKELIPRSRNLSFGEKRRVNARRSAERSALLNDIKRLKQRLSDLSSEKGEK